MNVSEEQSTWYEKQVIDASVTRYREPNVHLYFSANLFHVRGRDADLVVDFGMGLAPLTPELDIPQGKSVIAVATHVHADHVGAFHEFDIRLGHRLEAQGYARMADEDTVAHIFRGLTMPVSRLPTSGWTIDEYRIKPASLTRFVDEGDLIDLGDRVFEVLHLPGHSHGSIGLMDYAAGVLFSGDVIYIGGLVDDLPCSDKDKYLQTMQRLINLNVDIAYGGHGATMSGQQMREIAAKYIEKISAAKRPAGE